VYKIDDKINEISTKKKSEIQTPLYAFVTFESQEGFERCLKYLCEKTELRLKNKNKKAF
jgi:hypothetical protein